MRKILLFMLSLLSVYSYAQDTEFWFAPPRTLGAGPFYLRNAGFVFSNPTNVAAEVKIHFFRDNSDTTFVIPARGGHHHRMTGADIESKLIYPVTNYGRIGPSFDIKGGVHITSTQKIVVYYIFDQTASKDIFTLKGAPALGSEFYVPQSNDGYYLNGVNKETSRIGNVNFRDLITIIATEDNTTVSFKLPRRCFSQGLYRTADYAPNTLHNVTLQKGEVFTLAEMDRTPGAANSLTSYPPIGTNTTLSGTYIRADKPIAVTSAEDGANQDMMGDQIIPTKNLNRRYSVIKGYSNAAGANHLNLSTDRVYLQAVQNGTIIEIDTGLGWSPLVTLNEGEMYAYNMGNLTSGGPYAASFKATKPVACLHATAAGVHPAAGIVPSLYTLGQSDFTYYQIGDGDKVHNGAMLIYKAGTDTSFYMSYEVGGVNTEYQLIDPATNTLNPALTLAGANIDTRDDVPGAPGWKYMRLKLPKNADGKAVRLWNEDSPFSFGYYSGLGANNVNTNLPSSDPNRLLYHQYDMYGYLSTFSRFQFDPDTVWRCSSDPSPRILEGGYAENYKWILPDSSIIQGADKVSIYGSKPGMYILKMDQGQDPNDESTWTTDTCWIMDAVFDAKISRMPADPKPLKVAVPQLFEVDSKGVPASELTYRWTFEGGYPATSTSATPIVTWNATASAAKVTVHLSMTKGSGRHAIVCDTLIERTYPVKPTKNGYFVDQHVRGGEENGSDWSNAYRTVQDALTRAYQGDYIWVAQGVYSPPEGDTYLIDYDSVAIYGGFNATETSLSQRDPSRYRTVLRGNGNSVVTFDGSTNYRNVGRCGLSRQATLDGFVVQGGRSADGAGVLFRNGASGTVAYSVIRDNVATGRGGGIYIDRNGGCATNTSPALINLEISENGAASGGGIYNNGSDFLATNLTIANNAAQAGGGFYNNGGDPLLRNTILWANRDASAAGASTDVTNASGTPAYAFSLVGGSRGSGANWNTALGADSLKNIDRTPNFRQVPDPNTTRVRGNYRLISISPAVNSGNNRFVAFGNRLLRDITLLRPTDPTVGEAIRADLDMEHRIGDDIVDMGAYEFYFDAHSDTIVHRVNIPLVPNLITLPERGEHFVHGHDHFRLELKAAPGYSLAGLQVKTGSKAQDELGNMAIIVHPGDTTATVIFHQVTEELNVEIGGIALTNDAIDTDCKLYATAGQLIVEPTVAGSLRIYNIAGISVLHRDVAPGRTVLKLPAGVYIVTFDNRVRQKVVVP